jgi:hypothetical protein
MQTIGLTPFAITMAEILRKSKPLSKANCSHNNRSNPFPGQLGTILPKNWNCSRCDRHPHYLLLEQNSGDNRNHCPAGQCSSSNAGKPLHSSLTTLEPSESSAVIAAEPLDAPICKPSSACLAQIVPAINGNCGGGLRLPGGCDGGGE